MDGNDAFGPRKAAVSGPNWVEQDVPPTTAKGKTRSDVSARRTVVASADVTSVWICSGFPEPSLQGHFSPGFDGACLWSEWPRSCFDFVRSCFWAQHGLVTRAFETWDFEAGAGVDSLTVAANN